MGRRKQRKTRWFAGSSKDVPAMRLHACIKGQMQGAKRHGAATKAAAAIILILILSTVLCLFAS